MTAREAICAALPPLGAHVLASHVIASSGLHCAVAWGNLAVLCCEGKATVSDGWVTRGRQIQRGRKIDRTRHDRA
jgi:hypothetical protein